MNAPLQAAAAGVPPEVHSAQHYEDLAPSYLHPATHAYVAGGSGRDRTLAANRAAFDAWHILPRLLRPLQQGHTRLRMGGHDLAHPLLLAPVALQALVHPLAERATAQGAAAADALVVASTLSSLPLEDIARASAGPKWFQLYLQPQRADSLRLLQRAQDAGYQAIVLTLDASVQAPSQRALRAGFRLPPGLVPANLQGQDAAAPTPLAPGEDAIFQGALRHAPVWDDLDWLLAHSRLPVWVKGVLSADDAQALCARGVAGLVVSNHGGRTVDGVPAALHRLPAVRQAVGPACPLLLDSGVRSGADAFKALALGADAVLLGRLPLYALAVAGALGVAHVMKLLREELALNMALAGCATLDEIGPHCLVSAAPPTA